MTLISIFLIEGYSSCHSERKINNLLDLLYKTTIGNIESSSFTCQSFGIDILKNENFTFNFDCQSLNISSISSFSVSKSKDIEIKNKYQCFPFMTKDKLDLDTSNCDMRDYVNKELNTSCRNKTKCSMTLDMTKTTCNIKNEDVTKIFFTYTCWEYDKIFFQVYD